jgi:8-oxo-dGTP pyrophosphatase MutT (NUDIX family)
MNQTDSFLGRLVSVVNNYRNMVALPQERLAVLNWQIEQGHALDERATMPGHVTTSAIIVSPDHQQVLLIDHVAIGRWLQPGGHYEPADQFFQSAAREAVEETGVSGLTLHPWHQQRDLPLVIDTHDVPGKAARHEADHVHHDLQYLFLANPSAALQHQPEEVHAAQWKPIAELVEISPTAAHRLAQIPLPHQG